MNTTNTIHQFYTMQSTDSEGRLLQDYLDASNDWLEKTHDYIQWMFPLQEPSKFNSKSPILTEEDRIECVWDEEFYSNLRAAWQQMMLFYSLPPHPVERPLYDIERLNNWITPGNHNFLRLTRILKSCMLLGAERESRHLFRELRRIYKWYPDIIGETTMTFWMEAVGL